jgi:hypothetical protein
LQELGEIVADIQAEVIGDGGEHDGPAFALS